MSIAKRCIRFFIARTSEVGAAFRHMLIAGLTVGRGCKVYKGVRLRVVDGGACSLGDHTVVERFCEITASGGIVDVGSDSFIGQGSILVGKSRISIGKGCLIAEHVTIRDQNHRFGHRLAVRNSGFDVLDVLIGDNVWIGAKVSILPGVEIGSNCVIGAGSVVTRSFPPNMVIVGNPARAIRSINERVC
jgi:acetyltransferase-like isoleucine patch superfamily enzyme